MKKALTGGDDDDDDDDERPRRAKKSTSSPPPERCGGRDDGGADREAGRPAGLLRLRRRATPATARARRPRRASTTRPVRLVEHGAVGGRRRRDRPRPAAGPPRRPDGAQRGPRRAAAAGRSCPGAVRLGARRRRERGRGPAGAGRGSTSSSCSTTLEGRAQFNLRATYDEDSVLAEVVAGGPGDRRAARAHPRPPRGRGVRRPGPARASWSPGRWRTSASDDADVLLDSVAAATSRRTSVRARRRRRPRPRRGAARRRRPARTSSRTSSRGWPRRSHERIRLRLVGPVAPYDFVGGELMGLITGLLGLPLAPLRGTVAVAEQIQQQAEEEFYDPARIRAAARGGRPAARGRRARATRRRRPGRTSSSSG